MKLISQEMRKLAPELDPLRIGTGWKKEDLSKVQVMIESTYGDSHPGSGHLNVLVEEVRKGIAEENGYFVISPKYNLRKEVTYYLTVSSDKLSKVYTNKIYLKKRNY